MLKGAQIGTDGVGKDRGTTIRLTWGRNWCLCRCSQISVADSGSSCPTAGVVPHRVVIPNTDRNVWFNGFQNEILKQCMSCNDRLHEYLEPTRSMDFYGAYRTATRSCFGTIRTTAVIVFSLLQYNCTSPRCIYSNKYARHATVHSRYLVLRYNVAQAPPRTNTTTGVQVLYPSFLPDMP